MENNKPIIAAFLGMLALFLGGCATNSLVVPNHLPEPEGSTASSISTPSMDAAAKSNKLTERIQTLPRFAIRSEGATAGGESTDMSLPGGVFDLNVDAIPLAEFIHVALGDVLGMTFHLDDSIKDRKDLVTLRISKAVKAKRFLGYIEQTLSTYDVGLAWDSGSISVVPSNVLSTRPPTPVFASGDSNLLAVRGRVMTILPLQYTTPSEVLSVSKHFLSVGSSADILVLPRLNSLLVIGIPAEVNRFQKAIDLIDRPSMSGRALYLVKSVFWQSSAVLPLLKDALLLQGFSIAAAADQPGVYLSDISQLNSVLVAAPSKDVISWVADWLETIDTPEVAGESLRSYVYFAQHSNAKDLGKTVSSVLSGISETPQDDNKNNGTANISGSNAGDDRQSALRVVVDEAHNSLVFVGSAQQYQTAYQLLQQLDVPAKQVLIEVTIADISLDKVNQLGVEWQHRSRRADGSLGYVASTLNGLGLDGGGLNITGLDSGGLVRATLSALVSKGDARILSSPKLLAVDNEEARIQVGDQIAVITQEVADVTSTNNGNNVLRTFSYVDTGVILRFVPTVMANGVVRLDVYQEVSAAGASTNNTPPISKRTVETTLVAESGKTIMLGGLITHNEGKVDTQVPILGDIPIIGSLFRNRKITNNSTEMIILITPHVIENFSQAEELTKAFREELDWLE